MMSIMILTILIISVTSTRIPIDQLANITVGVIQHYQSTHIYVVHLTDKEGFISSLGMMKLEKQFSRKGIAVGTFNFEALQTSLENISVSPLLVIPHADRKMQLSLQQVSWTTRMSDGKWLIFLEEYEHVQEFFAEIQIPINCEVLVAQRSIDQRGHFKVLLTEVYQIHSSLPLQIRQIGNWNISDGLIWSIIPFHQRRGDLKGIVIKGAVIPIAPYIVVSKYEGNKPVTLGGTIADILDSMQHRLNFSFDYCTTGDGHYGSQDENGTWNGVTGLIVKSKVEIGVNLFSITSARAPVVSYLPAVTYSKFMVHIRQPKFDHSSFRSILFPFSISAWKTVFITILTIAVILWAVWSFGTGLYETKKCSFCNSLFYVFGSFCQQGHDITPSSCSCRLIYLTAYLTSAILFVAYAANFISQLTTRTYTLPFTDFRGLFEDGSYKLGVIPKSSHEDYFKKSSDQLLRNIYTKLIKTNDKELPLTDMEGLQRICEDNKYGFLVSQRAARILASQLPCSITAVSQAYYSIATSMILRKQSVYSKIFGNYIQELRRNGVLKRINDNFSQPKYQEVVPEQNGGVSLNTVSIIFVIWLYGVLISIFIFIVEFRFAKLQRSFTRHRLKKRLKNLLEKVSLI